MLHRSRSGSTSVAARDAVGDLRSRLAGLPEKATFDDLIAVAASVDDRVIARFEDWGKYSFGKTEAEGLGEATNEVAGAASRLAALLISGDPDREVVRFRMAGIVCLGKTDTGWAVNWAVTPEIVGA